MIITEAELGPYRRESGITTGEMPFRGLKAHRRGISINSKFFTPSLELIGGELRASLDHPAPERLEIVLFLAFTTSVPILRHDYEWWAVDHQAGGHATEHFTFIGVRLTPRPPIYEPLRQIARDRWHAKGGQLYTGRVTARDIAAYSGALENIGLDCDHSYPHLVESVYPIDAVQDNLDRVAEGAPRLDELGVQHAGLRGNKNLIIVAITENSD